jgi:hypothetical protein
LETIKHFLISLAKEGLVGGHILHDNRKYVFRKVKGLAQVDIVEAASPVRKEQPTEKREPLELDQKMEVVRSRPDEISRKSPPYKYIAFILIFIAAIMLVIFGLPWLGKKSEPENAEESSWLIATQQETPEAYRRYIREYPQGRYSLEAVARMGKLEQQADKDREYQQLLARAEKYLADGELDKAVQSAEQAKAIKKGEDIEALLQRINNQIDAQGDEKKYVFYLEMARQAFAQNDLEKASANLADAKNIHQGPEIEKLDRKIKEQIDKNERQKKQSGLIARSEEALVRNDLEQATAFLIQAKEIEINADTAALETKINEKQAAEKKRLEEQKIDDVYGRYFGFARNYLQEGKYDQALENIHKARKIKDTEELTRFEAEVRQKQTEQSTRFSERQKSEQYTRFMEAARNDFDKGRYENALDAVRKAREINDTDQANQLEKEILRIREGLEKEKQRIEEEKRKKGNQVAIRSVKIIDLPPQLINTYNENLKMFEIVKLIRGIRVIGQINLILNVREDGKVSIQRLSDAGLEVNPPNSRKTIISRIFKKIGTVKLPPPMDRKGFPVRVENWRLSYSVGTFANKVIFRRKF